MFPTNGFLRHTAQTPQHKSGRYGGNRHVLGKYLLAALNPMIQSAQDDNTGWNEASQSSEPGGNMLDPNLNFSNLSISGMQMNMVPHSGNRPPALSVSSISSIGEEMNMPQKGDFTPNHGYNGSTSQSHPPPSSPLSSASARSSSATLSHSWNNSAISSPITCANAFEGSYSKSLPTFEELAEETDASAGGLGENGGDGFGRNSFEERRSLNGSGGRAYSFHEPRDTYSRLLNGMPNQDLSDNGSTTSVSSGNIVGSSSVFGGWPSTSSNNRLPTAHSLSNMGSVDENEQYLGNRARASSAAASLGFHRHHSGSFVPSGSLSVSSTGSGFEDPIHSYGHSRSAVVDATYSPRQRVMSADAVHNNALRNQRMYDLNKSSTFSRAPLDGSNIRYVHNNVDNNSRPRSFSTGNGNKNMLSNPNLSVGGQNNELLSPSSRVAAHKAPRYFQDYNNYGGGIVGTSSSHSQEFLNSNVMDGHVADHVTTPQTQAHDEHYNGYSHNATTPRAYMYEHIRTQEIGYSNQDRIIRLQQSYGPSSGMHSVPYYQSREVQMNHGHSIYHGAMGMGMGMCVGMGMSPVLTPRTVYTVKFKRSQKNFFLSDQIKGDIKIGSYVKVEADRGEDLGIVLSRIPIEKFNPGARLNAPNHGIPDLQLKRIIRLASDEEISLLGLKEEEEAELLKICRSKTMQRGLPMNVVDAEYQFDRHKLTFFFEANCRVDFRELVRDLFSIYKTRIWMQQIDKVPGSSLSMGAPMTGSASGESLSTYEAEVSASNTGNISREVDTSATDAGGICGDNQITIGYDANGTSA